MVCAGETFVMENIFLLYLYISKVVYELKENNGNKILVACFDFGIALFWMKILDCVLTILMELEYQGMEDHQCLRVEPGKPIQELVCIFHCIF